jgi:hypothetical protein
MCDQIEKVKDVVVSNIQRVGECFIEATTVVKDVHNAVEAVCRFIDEDLNALRIEGTKEYESIRKLLVKMDSLFYCSSTFAYSVRGLFERCNETKLVQIQCDLYNGDTSSLTSFLYLMKELIDRYEDNHENFEKNFKETSDSVLASISVLNNLHDTARDKKNILQAIGIGSLVLMGGVAIAIVGGLFAFGIGFLPGLVPAIAGVAGAIGCSTEVAAITGSVAVAGGVAGGVTAAGVTLYKSEEYSRKAKKFKQMMEKLDVLHRQMGNLHEKLMDIKTGTDCIISEMNTVHFCLNIQDDYSNVMMVCEQLRFLLQNRNQCWDCIERECQEIELIHINIRQSRRSL